ncbi:nucleolar protein 12-domain-containing protein [Elsinoe ampelina]|uniref:Nucleolar protein 12-domain-containing protein n=1 Tax=Elsinoe ampelina TaxID=302913 RepID=A0A6A6G8V7_9PEZI|nr:nucleolar protein 12-domain-containing protein [Elsinoe ampelina]
MKNTAPPPKRRKVEPVEQVTFDPDARQEYLTGYHKRKVQRANHAREIAQKKDREEKIVNRRELREQRKREAEERVEQVNAFMRAQADSDNQAGADTEQNGEQDEEAEVFEGFGDAPAVSGQDEYVDEDKYTTVVVKELDDIRDYESGEEEAEGDEKPEDEEGTVDQKSGKKSWTKKRPLNDKTKKKKKRDFRYESKVERRTERKKQKLKNSAAAKARKGK